MYNIPNAKESPRIVNGVLFWYDGDTFEVQLTLDLEDQDGEAIEIDADDTVKVVFRDAHLDVIKEFAFTGIEDNTVTMAFDSGVTALFPQGSYTYDVTITRGERTTLASENKAEVE